MKQFLFVYEKIGGGSACVTVSAKNEGIAISKFKKARNDYRKIIKIKKEK